MQKTCRFLKLALVGIPSLVAASFANANLSIESAKPFQLEQTWDYQWEKEKPKIHEATLIVVHGPEDVVTPQQGFEAVVLVEGRVAERVRVLDSERMGMIVPGLVSTSALIWQGPNALPENIGKERRQQLYQVAKAEKKSQQGFVASLKEAFGLNLEAPVPEAETISSSADLYKASDSLR